MTEFDLPTAAYIRLDLAPAILRGASLPNGVLDKRRVIITDAFVYVFSDAAGGPVLSFTWELVDITGRPSTGYDVTIDDGEVIHIRRSGTCLCGSKLRGIRPFPGVPHQAMY